MRFFFPFLFILATSSPAKADLTYVVKRGDSLYSIAKKFHLSVEEIQEANELGRHENSGRTTFSHSGDRTLGHGRGEEKREKAGGRQR